MSVVRNASGTWRAVEPNFYSGGAWRGGLGSNMYVRSGGVWRLVYSTYSSGSQAIGLTGSGNPGIPTFTAKGQSVDISWETATGDLFIDVAANVDQYWLALVFWSKTPENSTYRSNRFTFTAWDGAKTRFTVTGSEVNFPDGSGNISFTLGG